MNVATKYGAKVAFTLGDLDTEGNIKDPRMIVQYISTYGNSSVTYMSPTSLEGTTFYFLPVNIFQCKEIQTKLLQLTFLDSNTDYCNKIDRSGPRLGCVSLDQYKRVN